MRKQSNGDVNVEGNEAEFECQELSFIRSFSKGSWFSNMYMLPVTARFLTDVNLKVNFGEIHGVIGASGSGKSTLLQVISHRVDGKVTGGIKLNGEALTERNFTKLCKFINFNMELMPYLTLGQLIRYHAQVCLNCTVDVLSQRISMLMQKFDLLSYVHKRVDTLSQSARYRLIIVLNLLSDPLLVLLDDPLNKLDALSNYQLMASLREYVKENSRMAIVTMRYPRSDIYQLMDGLTLLFYGEVVYSGTTKYMPHYFSQIGYKCPITENPAVYYLSLATVDRENPESYAETQEKANELVQTFKKRQKDVDISIYRPNALSDNPILSNYYSQPSFFRHCYLLSLRNVNFLLRSWSFMVVQSLYFMVFLFVAVFGAHFYTNTKHIPLSTAGTIFTLVYFTSLITIFKSVINFESTRSFIFWEVSNSLYNAALIPLVTVVSTLPLDLFVLTVSSTTFLWIVNPAFYTQHLLALIMGLSCVMFSYKFTVITMFSFIKDSHVVIITCTMLAGLSSTLSSGFLKSYQGFNSVNEGLLYVSSLCPERFVNLILDLEFVNVTKSITCHRSEQTSFINETDFCRWKNGNEYLLETLADPVVSPEEWQGLLIVMVTVLLSLATYFVINPKRALLFSIVPKPRSIGMDAPKTFEINRLPTVLAVLFLILAAVLNELVLAWVHDHVPRSIDPLPDTFFRIFPEVPEVMFIAEYIMLLLTLSGIAILILHQHRWIVIRRVMFCTGLCYTFRAFCIFLFQVPVPSVNTYCAPQVNTSANIIFERIMGIFWSAGIEQLRPRTLCGDLIVSGHTITIFISAMVVKTYAPRKLVIVGFVYQALAFVALICILLARKHYSIDVVAAYMITTRTFWEYHSLAMSYQDGNMERNMLSQSSWSPLIKYLEADAPPAHLFLNVLEWPSSCPQKIRRKFAV
ncbi:unnamed protein product [Bursaphelenchus okinawaensis]|uniref:ABC transporter domain-containing protein n=1 Tax=Bursaphelenchus okinawaensis TaxID=465554 RepID=A0A811K6N1_9BILA|nr:unnamed protein product [Bursaphelenchus okinawaensis]CAG9092610.1 unnamed protein product [Bursaphelenchus okinawaensis]